MSYFGLLVEQNKTFEERVELEGKSVDVSAADCYNKYEKYQQVNSLIKVSNVYCKHIL